MVKGSNGLTIRTRICSTSSRRRAPGTCAKGTGMFPRTAGEQLRVDGRFHQGKRKMRQKNPKVWRKHDV